MTNHPLDDVADHERSNPPPLTPTSITPDQPRGLTDIHISGPDAQLRCIQMVSRELEGALARYGPMRSPHEGYAVLLEEVDELWDEIKKNDKNRCKKKMLAEAKQVAAMAIRFMLDVCGSELTSPGAFIFPGSLLRSKITKLIYRATGEVCKRPDTYGMIGARVAGVPCAPMTWLGRGSIEVLPERRSTIRRERQPDRRSWERKVSCWSWDGVEVSIRDALKPVLIYTGRERRGPISRRQKNLDRRWS
jgi:hypothetical protein